MKKKSTIGISFSFNKNKIEVTKETTSSKPTTPKKLKNKKAELLRKEGVLFLNDIEIKLWQKNTTENIKDQLNWNKLDSFKKINQNTTGENGNIVITGVFQIPRKEVAEYATKFNFSVKSTVSKFTDYIVIGTENVSPTKIAKAIEYNEKGANIQIIEENTFLALIAEHLNS